MTDAIDQLLSEAGMSDEAHLREFLAELRGTSTAVRPLPSPELGALLVPRSRRSATHRRRVVITTLVVVGTLGAGASAAAASPEVRAAAGQVLQTVVGALTPPTAADPGPETTHSSQPAPAPRPSETASGGHPGPTDHPGAPSHPGTGDHPGVQGSGHGNSDDHPDPGRSHPTGVPTDPANDSAHGGGSSEKP